MAVEYSVELCKKLEQRFEKLNLHRPFRVQRYDAGDALEYDVTPTDAAAVPGRVRLEIEKFVGGGFAGQVYRARVLESEETVEKLLPVGTTFALKILIPPSGGSLFFRNVLHYIGFQGAFQLQTNPTATRAGALWQKFIRRGARVRFGDDSCVNDVHCTFVDHTLGSCGEISNWIDGRVWQLEVDDRVDLLKRWRKGKTVDEALLGSPEYRAKRRFMKAFVKLLNDMGAHEFARQYEWSTCKSQPNCLKRNDTDADPEAGLTAVDFRAGLTLLPFLPMSPGDFLLILKGLGRGSLVQFDRGNLEKLRRFVQQHPDDFAGMGELLEELEAAERVYRDSLIDITHHHFRLLFSGALWRQIFASAVSGWRVRGLIDEQHEKAVRGKSFVVLIFQILGLLPFVGRAIVKTWGEARYRRHYGALLTSISYFRRALAGKMLERVVSWHRAGRVEEHKAERVATSGFSFFGNAIASFLPLGIHKCLTSREYLKERLHYILVRPVKLYFKASLREQWLRDMVHEGQQKRIINEDDADTILSRIKEPFIQKYLKSLAVHVCTLPVTQIVSLIVAGIFWALNPDMPAVERTVAVAGILFLFQVVPISPGSLVRGFYVVYLVVRERNFKDYNIAVFLGFFKYVGYLAFPIQMAYRYPTLARFMAAHWATDAVHIVPVFGENGALLEHKVFTWFYNVPLTIRGRMRRRAESRSVLPSRLWHVLPVGAIGAAALLSTQYYYGQRIGHVPTLAEIWWAMLALPLLCGSVATLGAGGAALSRRIIGATLCGVFTGVLFSLSAFGFAGWVSSPVEIFAGTVWVVFILSVLSPIGAAITELVLPEP
jgi:hypothetical protein